MTLTAPGCPVAGEMPGWVENAVASVPGVGQVKVKLVFDPPWDMSRMSDEAQLELNMFYCGALNPPAIYPNLKP